MPPPSLYDNSHLIKKIFAVDHFQKQFCKQDFLKFRLVSKQWNAIICVIFQKSETVEFHLVADISRYVSIFPAPTSNTPYLHSRYYFCKVRLNHIYDNFVLRSFFKKFYSQVNHLEIDLHGPQFRMKNLRLSILERLVVLKTLILNCKDFYEIWPGSLADDPPHPPTYYYSVENLTLYGFGREAPLNTLVSKLLPYFPNIRTLEAGEQQGRLIFEYFQANPSYTNYLKNLDLHFIYPNEIKIIMALGLELKSLKTEVQCDESLLSSFLDYLTGSAEVLSLAGMKTSFPKLAKEFSFLHTLELVRFNVNTKILFSNNMFPVLKNLTLKLCTIETTNSNLDLTIVPTQSLRFLRIEQTIDISPEILKDVSLVFPSLTCLALPHVIGDKVTLRELISNFLPKLACLELGSSE